ncbi:MAG: outer membrane protein assembly factor BamA [Candidatus Latescibacterota bacterium]|nr:MAG: outer membrane protein assembly factor BamA [Candidatus Latescibacterota bacterium]
MNQRNRRIDITPWVFAFAILSLIPWTAGNVSAQDLELEPKSKEPYLGRVLINGNESFSDKDLKRLMKTKEPSFFAVFKRPRINREDIRRDVASIQGFYRANGFLDAKVELAALDLGDDGAFADVVIRVVEGEATRVKRVDFHNQGIVTPEKLAKEIQLKPGVPFNPSYVNSDVYAIKRKYFEKGYLAVEVIDSISVVERSVTIDYRITPGPVIKVGSIAVRGNQRTKDYIVRREVVLKEDNVFKLGDAIETQRNLFETGLFTEAEIITEQLDTEARTVDVIIRVRERKPAYFEVGFGVGNIYGSRLTGAWGNRNIFGRGRMVAFKVEYSIGLFESGRFDLDEIDPKVRYYRYDLELGQRNVFGTRWIFGINAFYEQDATVEPLIVRSVGGALVGARHLSRRTDLVIRPSYARIERKVPDVPDTLSTTLLVSSTVSHDTRNFILDPRSGGYRDLRLELAGSILGADNDFYTASTALQKYWPWNRSVIALRARVGYANAYGRSKDSGVPVENRYFTGGGNSVRGFRENSLGPKRELPTSTGDGEVANVGGEFLLVTNAEIRFPLPLLSRWRFSAAVFLDGGNAWGDIHDVSWRDFRPTAPQDEVEEEDYRYSVGTGIRYNTPVGPIRLDVGFPIKKDELTENYRFHLSLGQIF